MNSISHNEKSHFIHLPHKKRRPSKSYEGYARPSDRMFENMVKKFEEDTKAQRIYNEYICKIDGQTNGI